MHYKNLEQQAHAHDNDYTDLEALYRYETGGELVSDPYVSLRQEEPITLSASVVIPAWNACDSLEQCLNLPTFRANIGYDMMAFQHHRRNICHNHHSKSSVARGRTRLFRRAMSGYLSLSGMHHCCPGRHSRSGPI